MSIDKIRRHYLPRINSKTDHHDILDWAESETQMLRFEILTKYVNLQGQSLLDIGCGLGDLAIFLQRQGLEVDYTGVDVLAEMLDKARLVHPELNLIQADLFNTPTDQALEILGRQGRFDVVFCSGALNLNLGNNIRFVNTAIPAMLALADKYLVFNCLHARMPICEPEYFSYWPEDIVNILRPLPRCGEIRLLDEYLANDFTIVCKVADE